MRKITRNKRQKKKTKVRVDEGGYTLLYTLMIMALILSLSAYLFTKVDLYRSLVESKKYTANTYLAAETLVISEGERIAGRFNKLNGSPMMNEVEDFEVLARWNQAYGCLYYTACTYLEVTQSLFQEPIVNYYLARSNQVRPKYIMKIDRKRPHFLFEVESRVNPYNVQNVSNPLKKDLTKLEEVDKAVKKIAGGLQNIRNQQTESQQVTSLKRDEEVLETQLVNQQGIGVEEEEQKQVVEQEKAILDTLIPQFKILETELLKKPLYEVESIARIVDGAKTLSSQTLYLTLYIEEQEDALPYEIEGNIYNVTLPYELKTGYLKAKKHSN